MSVVKAQPSAIDHAACRAGASLRRTASSRSPFRIQKPPLQDAVASAETAGLQYVTDAMPGFRRRRCGRHFRYLDAAGNPIRDPEQLARIASLRIPPAWTSFWICPLPNGHLQATGRDSRGRKQYRYHPDWRAIRNVTRFDRLLAFGCALPSLRQRIRSDVALPGLPRQKVLATVVLLLERTMMRVGNAAYARENGSFGLSTLHDEHVDIDGSALRFHFRGKSGKDHVLDVQDRRIAAIVKRCRDLPGQELFQYLDASGCPHPIRSDDINQYLRDAMGADFTAKDFRTWAGTLLCARELSRMAPPRTDAEAQHGIAEAIRTVARCLGNTPAVCRTYYVHPVIMTAYRSGTLASLDSPTNLATEEARLLALLSQSQRDTPPTASPTRSPSES